MSDPAQLRQRGLRSGTGVMTSASHFLSQRHHGDFMQPVGFGMPRSFSSSCRFAHSGSYR